MSIFNFFSIPKIATTTDTLTYLIYSAFGIVLIYLLWRLIVLFLPKTKKSIKDYPSRFIFRLITLLRTIALLVLTILSPNYINEAYIAAHISYCVGDIAYQFLIRSIQDFAIFINRENSFIYNYFFNITSPLILSLWIFQAAILVSDSYDEDYVVSIFSMSYDALFGISELALVFIPIFIYLIEIDKNDMSGQKHRQVVLGYIFTAIATLSSLALGATNSLLNKSKFSIQAIILFREPLYLILSLTQDFIDGLINLMIADSESENLRIDPLNLGLVG